MSDLALSLQITLVGMGLVFGAILVLWGLMYLLTTLVREPVAKPVPAPLPETRTDPTADGLAPLAVRAAAAAVALALAEQGVSTAHPLVVPPPALVSAWQLGMRTRQMAQKGNQYKKGKR